MMRCSSPSILTSVPAYLPKRTRSPFFTSSGVDLAVVAHLALADGDDLALLGLLLGGVGDDDPALRLLFLVDALDEDAVLERTDLHAGSSCRPARERRGRDTSGSRLGSPCGRAAVARGRGSRARVGSRSARVPNGARNVCRRPRLAPRKAPDAPRAGVDFRLDFANLGGHGAHPPPARDLRLHPRRSSTSAATRRASRRSAPRFGLSSVATVHKHVQHLVEKGYLRKAWNRSRSVEPVEAPAATVVSLPLLGSVAAGAPIEAIEVARDDRRAAAAGAGRRGECFVLRVRGDSMIDEQIRDGDFVVVESAARGARRRDGGGAGARRRRDAQEASTGAARRCGSSPPTRACARSSCRPPRSRSAASCAGCCGATEPRRSPRRSRLACRSSSGSSRTRACPHVRLTRAIEFSTSLRYWNPDLGRGREPRACFGRKARQHGHNYRLEVTPARRARPGHRHGDRPEGSPGGARARGDGALRPPRPEPRHALLREGAADARRTSCA